MHLFLLLVALALSLFLFFELFFGGDQSIGSKIGATLGETFFFGEMAPELKSGKFLGRRRRKKMGLKITHAIREPRLKGGNQLGRALNLFYHCRQVPELGFDVKVIFSECGGGKKGLLDALEWIIFIKATKTAVKEIEAIRKNT